MFNDINKFICNNYHITFNDLFLIPQRSSIASRKSINTCFILNENERPFKLNSPIMLANMNHVSPEMCCSMAMMGGIGTFTLKNAKQAVSFIKEVKEMSPEQWIINKRFNRDKELEFYSLYQPNLNVLGQFKIGMAIGPNIFKNCEKYELCDIIDELCEQHIDLLILDTAHGHREDFLEFCMIARQKFPDIPICAGNVCTSEGYADLLSTGVDMVKVGVGPSPRCTTRLMTGVGVPQASALLDIKTYCDLNGLDYKYICDGGIYNGREISLAMALGSIAVMVGTRYSKVRENNTRYFDPLTEKWWGVSSGSAHFKTSSEIRGLTYNEYFPFSEGARSVVELNEDFISITHELISGLRSAMSYSNSKTIKEFHTNSKLGIQTNSGYVEGVSTVIK